MSKMSRDEFLRSVENVIPRTHEVEQTILDGKVSDDNREYTVDKITGLDPDGMMISVRNVSHKACDFGHLLQPKASLSKCQWCGKVICLAGGSGGSGGSGGCSYNCQKCGRAFCRSHVSVYSDGQAYCSNCKWYKHLMMLLGIIRKVVE